MTEMDFGRFVVDGGVFAVAPSAAPHTVRLYSVQGDHRVLACTISIVDGVASASWGAAWLGQPAGWYVRVEGAAVAVHREASRHRELS
ncbi:hypothetical protein LX16_2969 [Stackebrandtia albiflava]|uniref:Uncharacterized protein n=1 Tax=Stackebrandtia albiflava TaxID=406432 RepID=A0A562V2V5_9ACTN|nr:hypothetical protein [Stackebrandtia albiflava]TWJ12214.1 hypothetical protein LX16_2969 [Stackebrandtia albiflava]